MAKFCSQCGKPLSPDAKFCSECGEKVNSTVNLSKENPADNSTAERSMPTNTFESNRRVPDNGFVENFFRRDGRLNRWRYFKRVILLSVIQTVIMIIIFVLNVNVLGHLTQTGNILFKLVMAVAQVSFFCLMTRRLHDMDKSEKIAYVAVALNSMVIVLSDNTGLNEPSGAEIIFTLISSIIGLCVLLWPGTRGYNQYGADPLA